MTSLKELMDARDLTKLVLENTGMGNTVGLSPEDRIVLDIEWQRAIDAYQMAEMKYQSAVRFAAHSGLQSTEPTTVNKNATESD